MYKNGFLDKMEDGINKVRMHWYYGLLIGSGWDVVESRSQKGKYYWLKDDMAVWVHHLAIHYDGEYYIYDTRYPELKYLV